MIVIKINKDKIKSIDGNYVTLNDFSVISLNNLKYCSLSSSEDIKNITENDFLNKYKDCFLVKPMFCFSNEKTFIVPDLRILNTYVMDFYKKEIERLEYEIEELYLSFGKESAIKNLLIDIENLHLRKILWKLKCKSVCEENI